MSKPQAKVADEAIAAAEQVKRDPTDRERAAIDADRQAFNDKPVRPAMEIEVDGGVILLGAPHNDESGQSARVQMTFGSSSPDFASQCLLSLSNTVADNGRAVTQPQLNSALAFVAAVAPADEVEAALAVQMATTHDLTMDLLRRTRHAGTRDAMIEYGNLATKMQRTFTAQIEALAKLRRNGEQTVRVEHIHVYPGGQAIVGNVNTGGTDGKSERQSREPGAAAAISPAMLGYDPFGNGVPITGAEGEEAVPAPRRPSRRAERTA